ncbi:hypothetical protein NDU88_003816 [Pleurodeles waltl]|uniref:Uncharacterized protein n=1 Tax=Pleurodeles waltl TaxID=8319 RepID=A0AAV7LGJ5_PLEWA|nr:hypothetical protein NDU88_003816 [Pleurodeles waltl]
MQFQKPRSPLLYNMTGCVLSGYYRVRPGLPERSVYTAPQCGRRYYNTNKRGEDEMRQASPERNRTVKD